MLIFAIDNEPAMLSRLQSAIKKAKPEAEIIGFDDSASLLRMITDEQKYPDVLFSEIELGNGANGLELAVKLRPLSPRTKMIFVAEDPQYAVEAYRIHADGYILKPAAAERISEELAFLGLTEESAGSQEKLQVRCFGSFQVFWHGDPLIFKRSKTRELFAFLVDRNGAVCNGEEIIAAMWEGESNTKGAKQYLRALTQDLRNTLISIGMEDIFVRKHNQWAIRKDLIDCDYFRLLDGETDAVNAYRGDYMEQYTWGELTAAKLQYKAE